MPLLNRTSVVILHDTSINSNVGTSRVIRHCCLQKSEFQRGATGTRGFPEVPTRLTCCSRRYRAEWSLPLFTHNILESGTGTHGMYVPTRSSFGEFYSCSPHIESLFARSATIWRLSSSSHCRPPPDLKHRGQGSTRSATRPVNGHKYRRDAMSCASDEDSILEGSLSASIRLLHTNNASD